MNLKRIRLGLVLGGLYLSQWAYLATVGLPTGLWDLSYTQAEHKLETRPPYSQATIERFRQAARKAEELVPEDGRLARTYHDLGTLLWFTGQTQEARLYLHRSLEIFSRVDGPRSTWVGVVSERLGEIEMLRGHSSKALELLQRAELILVRTLGRFDPMALRASTQLALRTRDSAKARQVLENYKMTSIQLDPFTKLQLEQLAALSTPPDGRQGL